MKKCFFVVAFHAICANNSSAYHSLRFHLLINTNTDKYSLVMDPNQDKRAYFKLAQLYNALERTPKMKVIEKILGKEGDINYQIPIDSPIKYSRPSYLGYTALHIAHAKTYEVGMNLLSHGADVTKKNNDDQTVIHMMSPSQLENVTGLFTGFFLNSALSMHIKSNNTVNPCDKNGLSHFHVACMTSNTTVVQFFLDNGVSVDEAVSVNSKFAPGFTPIHFATTSANIKVVEILLSHGANMHMTDARGMTPLQILIECRIHMYDSIHFKDDTVYWIENYYEQLQNHLMENERVINMLMESVSSDIDSVDSIGLSNFHVACMLQDVSAAQNLIGRVIDLDHCIDMNSQLWPGYTALHFAAHISIERVEMLVNKGANLAARDSNGITPLNICINRYKIQDIYRVICLNAKYKNILFSDGQTKLVSFIRCLANRNHFKTLLDSTINDINMHIPMESPLWPGYTPLHFAVLFADKFKSDDDTNPKKDVNLQIIRLCLKHKADLTAQDSQGRTAFHLAYRLDKLAVCSVILRHSRQIPNSIDEDNLSHLHIVAALSIRSHTFKKCLFKSSEVNAAYKGTTPIKAIRPGWTPLHASISYAQYKDDFCNFVRILLKNGADPCARDAEGLTPIHWLLDHSTSYLTTEFFTPEMKDCVAEKYGVSHLHVVCYLNDVDAARRLLENGADVNLAIKCDQREEDDPHPHPLLFLGENDKYTPLHFCSYFGADMDNLLLDHGANVFADEATDESFPLKNSAFLKNFVSKIWSDDELQKRMRRDFGWTRLHLACCLLEADGFEDIVKAELADIRTRVHSSSAIWKGYTPLHVLIYCAKNYREIRKEPCVIVPRMYPNQIHRNVWAKAYSMSEVLLENGADVSVTNDQGDSPIGVLTEFSLRDDAHKQVSLLLKYQRDFSVNPISAYGVSHFHVACYLNDVDAVREFLSHGVDVNHPVDYFADWCPGYTPLQLASEFQIIELLIDHGADIHIENVEGRTILHKTFERNLFSEDVVKKILEKGADINSQALKGETPFEIAITEHEMTLEELEFFIRLGCHVNSCNPITGFGYVGIILERYYEDKNLQKLIIERIANENPTGTLGRTTLHHFVTNGLSMSEDDYFSLLDKLIRSGQDVDQQDNEGNTALHLAVKFGIEEAVCGLLMSGADINIVDTKGKSALLYACKRTSLFHEIDPIKNMLVTHARRLISLKLYLSQANEEAIPHELNSLNYFIRTLPEFLSTVSVCKDIKVGVRSMYLDSFLEEMGAVSMYPSLNQSERREIDQYFESIEYNGILEKIQGFLKLQYRKAVKRVELLSLAMNSFRFLLGFDLPDLCVDDIFKYLYNSDLKNIISAEIENEHMQMDVD